MKVMGQLSLAALLAMPVAAQDVRGHLHGAVINPDGTPAAGVSLRLVHEDTGEARRLFSSASGRFAIADLRPGTYRLRTEAGISPAGDMRAIVWSGQTIEQDLHLGVTPITAESDVRSTFVPLDRYGATVRTRIPPDFFEALPLDGRTTADLALLATGVSRGLANVGSNGAHDLTSYDIDGAYAVDPWIGAPAVRLPLDAIDTLDVRTLLFDTSFGRTGGPQIGIVSRAGSNQVAGGGFLLQAIDPERTQVGGFGGGPLARNRTFGFASYQFTGNDDGAGVSLPTHLLSARADHVFNDGSRAAGRYALDSDAPFGRRGQIAGASWSVARGMVTNETRFGFTHLAFNDDALSFSSGGFGPFGDVILIADSTAYQLTNVTSWASDAHLVTGGVEWHGVDTGLQADGMSTIGLFAQNTWTGIDRVALTAGARFDHASLEDMSGSTVSPRLGAAWTADRARLTVVRGGYGIYRNYATRVVDVPRLQHWSLGVQRQIGRARLAEIAYVGTRGDDESRGAFTSRYNALQMELEQRSERGLSALVSYTYCKASESFGTGDSVRAPLDARHRLMGAFVAALPFGDERRWFSKGIAATILGNMELSGVLIHHSGRPGVNLADQPRPSYRTVDLALLKHIAVGGGTLQLRLESFNLTDRANLEGRRRYQIGGRYLFADR